MRKSSINKVSDFSILHDNMMKDVNGGIFFVQKPRPRLRAVFAFVKKIFGRGNGDGGPVTNA